MHNILVVDSSVLIALNSGTRLQTQLKHLKAEGYEIIIPPAIAEEVIDEPKKFAEEIKEKSPVLASKITDSTNRISTAIEQGLIRVEPVDYRKYSKVMDNVRKHLSTLEAKPEHAIKKGDPELVALVIQSYDKTKKKIAISTLDKGLIKALKPFSKEVKYEILKF
jgi:hypothetical protein